MDNRQRGKSENASGERDLAQPPETSAATDAAGVDAIPPSVSCRLAQLYLPPLAHLFALSLKLDELIGPRWEHDANGWRREVGAVVGKIEDEKMRLKAIAPAAAMALRCRGGQRGIIIGAETELAAKAADDYDRRGGVKAQLENLLAVGVNNMFVYGFDLPELELSDEERHALKSDYEERLKPRSQRRAANRCSKAITVYRGPIESLARALEREDVSGVARELGRVSEYVMERLERRLVEWDAINCPGLVMEAVHRRELNRRYFDLNLERQRISLIDKAAAGMLRCFGGPQRLAMEMAFRDNAESEAVPANPSVKAILERLSTDVLKRGDAKRADDQ